MRPVRKKESALKRLKLITLIVAALLVMVFVLQNTATVQVQFLLFDFAVPATVLFIVLLLAGFVIGAILGQRMRSKRKKEK